MSSSDLSGYNTNDGDGCSSLWAIESNYICNGDSTSSSDSYSACPAGSSPDATKTSCVATCGDRNEQVLKLAMTEIQQVETDVVQTVLLKLD